MRFLAALLFFFALSLQARAAGVPGMALLGQPKYGPEFKHFDYVDPDAPKGGEVRLAALGGGFDTLNPFILKGVPAPGIGLLFDTLMVQSEDEAFSAYGLVAETIETPPDRSWVLFTLRPQARFNDGSPITAADVKFSFDILREKGAPTFRNYYASVDKAEVLDPRRIKFSFKPGDNRELPLILGQLPVLSKAYWSQRPFDRTTMEAPLGSGPYVVEKVEPGRGITLRKADHWWAAGLPVTMGRFNFQRIRYDVYRDFNVAFEAFKAGQVDARYENIARNWATGYDVPAVRDGRILREKFKNENPAGIQAFIFNTRRPVFGDRRVRAALNEVFDFEWMNKTLFFNAYQREESYFTNSEMAAAGLPSGEELKVLEPFKAQLPPEVFSLPYHNPKTDGSGNLRENLARALALLGEAGWVVKGGKLMNAQGQPFQFEVLLYDPSFEKVLLAYSRTLERLGITVTVRTVDVAQYIHRLQTFDFDMVLLGWPESLSPGNEQRDRWTAAAAGQPGSQNYAGIHDPAVDRLVDLLIASPDRPTLVARTRALDRVLLWGHYVIPNWFAPFQPLAYWNKFGHPKALAKYVPNPLDSLITTWWILRKE